MAGRGGLAADVERERTVATMPPPSTAAATALRIAVAQPEVCAPVLAAAGQYALGALQDDLLADVCAHPALPRTEAAALCGTSGLRPLRAAGVVGFLRRSDLNPEDCRWVHTLGRFGRDPDHLAALVRHPETSAEVLNAAIPLLRGAGRTGWQVLDIALTHPNATPDTAVAVFVLLSSPELDRRQLASRFNVSIPVLGTMLRDLDPTMSRVVFDTLDHPELLTMLAEHVPGLLADEARAQRLVDVVIVNAAATPSSRGIPTSHRLFRAATLLARHAPLTMRATAASAMSQAGVLLAGAHPSIVLAVPQSAADRHAAAARLRPRSWRAVCKSARTNAADALALGQALADLAHGDAGAQRMMIWAAVADTHTGTVGELLDAVHAASAGPPTHP